MRRLLTTVLVVCLLAAACTSGTDGVTEPAAVPTAAATLVPTPAATATATPTPTPTSAPVSQLPDLDAALAVEPAPLGTYVVAKADAGIMRATVPGVAAMREIPVYDIPFGAPRSLVDANWIDGVNVPINLTNPADADGVLVMRVIAGGPDDDWIIVQSPTRPHDGYVWVRGSDFDFGYTNKRIEIDLANGGELSVYDGDDLILQSAIVQGRESRETPTHVTYLQRGIEGAQLSPAYGDMILSMASFSEVLGTFGGGGLPSNFIHGTNQPELMGQRVSSGEIRLPNEVLLQLVDVVSPGTPVLMFDSSGQRSTRQEILDRPQLPAATVDFLDGAAGAQDGTTGVVPEVWRRCPAESVELVCRNDMTVAEAEFISAVSGNETIYAVAKPDAGEIYANLTEVEVAVDRPLIPVFDVPGGSPRSLVDRNQVDGVTIDYPLYAETVFGQPTVLSVIKMTADGKWLLVRAPVRPDNTAVWVRGSDFDLRSTTLRVEVDLGYEFLGRLGMMSVWDGDISLMAAKISSGREHRPTIVTTTHIDQLIAGEGLSEAYGPWIFSTPSYSDTLGTFGGGGLPQQAIHAIHAEAEAILGTPASSGSIHVSNDAILEMVAIEGLVGAPVYIYDSRSPSTTERVVRARPVGMAETKPIALASREAPIPSFT